MDPGNRRVRGALRLTDGLPQRGDAEHASARRHGMAVGERSPGVEDLAVFGRRIQAGSAELEVVKRCERCAVITRDPDTTETSPELLRVLTETSDTCMGVYCKVVRPGDVAIGDLIGPV